MKKGKGKIIVIPNAWLGNRIRVISAAYALSQRCNRKLEIIWLNYDQGVNLPFSEIFEDPINIKVIEFKSRLMRFIFQSATKIISMLKFKRIRTCSFFINPQKLNENDLYHLNTIVIRTDSRFYQYQNIPLIFKSSIVNEGDRFLNLIKDPFIGMHIRRGDHTYSINNSPTELFIDIAEDEIYNKKNKIFLCTDDAVVKKLFIDHFGEKIFTRNVVLNKSSTHIIDAAIDMYCLSKAQKIYGSYRSSFSTIASEFNHIPIVRVTKSE